MKSLLQVIKILKDIALKHYQFLRGRPVFKTLYGNFFWITPYSRPRLTRQQQTWSSI